MNELKKINKEIQRTEKKRKAARDRILHYWKKLDALYEKQRQLMEGEHLQGVSPKETLSGN